MKTLTTTQIEITESSEKQQHCQDEDLSHEVSAMGNTKSIENVAENQELLLNIINDNIKMVCTDPDYKNNDICKETIQKLLNIVVNATNPEELDANIKNQNLDMFKNPLSHEDVKKFCQSKSPEIVESIEVVDQKEENMKLKPQETNKSVRLLVSENMRILRKSPSFSHDNISQVSVKIVSEILQKEGISDEEIVKELKHYNLRYFAESDKTQFWKLREENLNRIVMETLSEENEEEDGEKEADQSKETVKLQKDEDLIIDKCDDQKPDMESNVNTICTKADPMNVEEISECDNNECQDVSKAETEVSEDNNEDIDRKKQETVSTNNALDCETHEIDTQMNVPEKQEVVEEGRTEECFDAEETISTVENLPEPENNEPKNKSSQEAQEDREESQEKVETADVSKSGNESNENKEEPLPNDQERLTLNHLWSQKSVSRFSFFNGFIFFIGIRC